MLTKAALFDQKYSKIIDFINRFIIQIYFKMKFICVMAKPWRSRNIYYYYQCWKQLLLDIFVQTVIVQKSKFKRIYLKYIFL